MKLHGTNWAIVTVLVAAGCAAIYAGLARALRNAIAGRQRDTDRRLSALTMTIKALQSRVAELGRLQEARAREGEVAMPSATAESAPAQKPGRETMVALAAAATAFLGKKARIRSVHALPSEQEGAGAWAQQGRVIVQTSHNLRPRS